MSENGHVPGTDERVSQGKEYRLVIVWKPDVDEFDVKGLEVPPWVALGMLYYMEVLVRRRDAEIMMAAAAQNRSRLFVPGGKG